MEADVLFKEVPGKEGGIGVITLNRPAVLNSLNLNIIRLMFQKLSEWAKTKAIKAVVITGAGERAFCAGGDLRLTYELHQNKSNTLTTFFKEEYRLNSLIYHYPKPYIAFLDGITMGGGVGVSIHGSHRIATERLMFAMPETSIGLFPDVGGTYFLPKLSHHIGYYLGLTGARINADDCVALTIAHHKMSSSSFESFINALSETSFDRNPCKTVTSVIENFALPKEVSNLFQDAEIIETCFAEKEMETIFKKLKESSHPLLIQTLENLKKKSPISLKVTLSALIKGSTLTFDDCMKQEYHLVTHFLQNHDFFEGIRAVIIDKDQQPRWQPATLEEITDEVVSAYFLPPR